MARNEKGTGSLYQAKTKNAGILCVFQVFSAKHDGKYAAKIGAAICSEVPWAFFNDRGANGNLPRQGRLSPKALTNIRNMMHIAFDQALKNGMITVNFVESVRLHKAEKKEMRVLDREEQSRLVAAARLAPGPAAFGIIFDLFTGLRIGELCGLRWKNVNMDDHSIRVRETRNRLPNFDDTIETATSVKTVESTKTSNSRRTVYMTDSLYRDFQQYMNISALPQKAVPVLQPGRVRAYAAPKLHPFRRTPTP